jgi:hypothetical protein
VQTSPSILKHGAQIGEGLTSLRFKCRAGRLASRRIYARLTGGKDEVAYSHSLRVGPNSRNTPAVDDFLWERHRRLA